LLGRTGLSLSQAFLYFELTWTSERRSPVNNPGVAFFAGRAAQSRGWQSVDRQLSDKPVPSSHVNSNWTQKDSFQNQHHFFLLCQLDISK